MSATTASATTTFEPATGPQVKYINHLVTARVLDPEFAARLAQRLTAGDLDKRMASATITYLRKQPILAVITTTVVTLPAPVEETKAPELVPGVYVTADGTIVKLVAGKKNPDRLYPKIWASFGGTRLTLTGEHVKAQWTYAPDLTKKIMAELTEDMRMTKDQALQFTEIYRRCAACARQLKAAQSVEAGIGPICRKNFPGF